MKVTAKNNVILALALMILSCLTSTAQDIVIPNDLTGEARDNYVAAVRGDAEAQLVMCYCYRM